MTEAPQVSIVMGSRSDLDVMIETPAILRDVHVPHQLRVVSAHRTPDRAHEFGKSAKSRGVRIIITGAGKAAHLAGVLVSLTTVPVIGGAHEDVRFA
jgi:phosphoribosylaminoimidazole carboxylase PurE protein